MQQFNLEKWLNDKSRKIVTRGGRMVEILKVDAKGNHPIIGVYQFSDTEDMESSWRIDGRKTENGESSFDLFFADEEEELTELQKTLEEDCDCYVNLYNDGKTREELREWIKGWCPRIIGLVRKEIEKSNPYNEKQRQEWSEEDREMLDNCLGLIQEIDSTQEEQNWLKSLKPEYHWKPSEEQMNALDKAKNNPANYYDIRLGLQSLYNDLKKLKS